MKKVFAFLSVLLLTIACVGLSVKNAPAQAASNKWTVDPTLAEDEIPVYIMDSIMTTFPHYYDNDTKPDAKWQGIARMYPWNETRLRIAQLNDKGQPTGKYYAIYFAGHTEATDRTTGDAIIGAGKNILFWNVDASGNVVAEKYSDGKKASSGNASDPSLSHMRTNISGQAITFDPTQINLEGGEATNFYNRSVVFDGQGRVIRGVALDGVYSSAEATPGEVKFAPEYCRVNGVVTKIADGVVCDKALTEQLDENGETVRDADGNAVMVPSDKDDLIYSRFVWEYFTEEPTNVNTVPYLSKGWDAMLWDYCYAVEGGYMAIAFVGSADNTAHTVKGDQVEPYKETLIARYMNEGMTEADATAKAEKDVVAARDCVRELRIPAGGFTFDFGYLDRGKATCDEAFNSTVINGYLYGRTMLTKKDREGNPVKDEEGNEVKIGIAEQRTYNFSVSDVRYDDKVVDGTSYRLVNLPAEGLNVVEIMQGDVFAPTKNINYSGVMRYWNELDNLLSYKADANSLDLYISESANGGTALTKVEPNTGYTSMKDVLDDFVKDYNLFLAEKGGYKLNEETGKYEKEVEDEETKEKKIVVFKDQLKAAAVDWTDEQIVSDFYNPLGWDLCSTSGNASTFVNIDKYWSKWSWVFTYIATYATSNNASIVISGEGAGNRFVASPGFLRDALFGFFTESPSRSISGTWANTCGSWDEGKATLWLDARTNLQKWNDYRIDASTKAVGDNWVVTYKVINRETGNDSSLTVKYVVVDSYTPLIKFDAAKLRYTPRKFGDSYVIDPINPYEIVTAYDGQYNGVNILGNDITQNVVFETKLNFNKPVEGKHEVIATIKNNAGTKEASVKFVINVVDVTAPMVATRTVTIQQGQDFDPRDGITVAYDAVDGNLFDVDYEWWYQTTPSKAIDTNNVNNGENRKIAVTVEVSDRSGNTVNAQYSLVIIANKSVDKELTQLSKDVAALQETIDDVYDKVCDVQDTLETLTQKVNAMDANISLTKNAVDTVKATVDETKTTVNATKAAVQTSESEIKAAIDAVKTNTNDIKSSVDAVKESVDSLNTGKTSGCKSGALIALGLSTVIAAMAVLLKKRH